MPTTSEPVETGEVAATESQPRLYRSREQKVIAGVCGGLGDYFALDPVWFRIGFVVLAFGGGSGVLIYLLMWLIVPEQPAGESVNPAPAAQVSGAVVIGIVLMFVGTIALVNTMAPWLGQYFWPAILVIGGLALVLGGINRDTR
ncbi:MAG TPA: PspC domain-containing protein [Acidimicrobiia bacterium]|nr:PspC domain-containing protein [Acidimicrobiia bacterium]